MKALLSSLAAAVALTFSAAAGAQAVDAEAAQKLFKKNDCGKCHSVDKTKKGPSLKKIAEKYKGKADGIEKASKNMTTGPKVKLDDGSEEDHKLLDTKDEKQIRNLVLWILGH